MKPASDSSGGSGTQTPRYVACKGCKRYCAVRTGPRMTICLLSSGCQGSAAQAEPANADGVGESLSEAGSASEGAQPATARVAKPLQYQELYRRECIRQGMIAQRRELQNQWLAGMRARIASARQREVWAKRRQDKAEEEALLLRKQIQLLKKNQRLEETVGDLLRRGIIGTGQGEPPRGYPQVPPADHRRTNEQ